MKITSTSKRLLALALASASAFSLAACGGGSTTSDSSGSSSSGSGSTDSMTVTIWDSNQQAGIQAIADEWSETSGISVKVEVVTWDNYWTLLEAGVQGGTMPDVFWMHSNNAQLYMENDALLQLDDYIASDDAINLDNYYSGIVNLYTRSDGNVYAIPKDHDTIALLYNKAIFDEYGLAYPDETWSWEDVYEASAAIYEASGGDTYGYALNVSNNQDSWYNIVYEYGAEVINDTHDGTTIGSDEGKAAMEMVRQLLSVSVPQTVVAETGTDSLFLSNKVAMITQGSWMINTFYTAENADDYAWALLPYGDANGNGTCDEGERQSCYNGLGWAASADVADPDAAWSLISYLCSETGQKRQAELGVSMGGMMGVSDAFADAFPGLDISAFIDVEEYGLFFRPYTRKTTVWEDKLQQEGGFLDAWQNPDDADLMATACDNAQKIIEDAIAEE
jgi:multiple sugar transport system substrate-binding protein